MTLFEVSASDIEQLNAFDLTDLLRRLLLLEASRLGLAQNAVSVSLNIDAPDGGEDGKIEWVGGPDPANLDLIPRRCTLFQVKATDMQEGECYKEVLESEKRTKTKSLKPRVDRVVRAEGAYILFYGRRCAGTYATKRETKIQKAFSDCVGEATASKVIVYVYGSEKIAEWTNQYYGAITYVKERLGHTLPSTLQTWASWNDEQPQHNPFVWDQERVGIRDKLRSALQHPRQVTRLAGLSGLGKSRLALELFRPPDNPNQSPAQAALSAKCVYIKGGDDYRSDLVPAIRSMKEKEIEAIIVVDECSIELHRDLSQMVQAKKSKLSLLSLDYDLTPPSQTIDSLFRVLPRLSNTGMETLIKSWQPQPLQEMIPTIIKMADGFPRMAELLLRHISEGHSSLWNIETPESFKTLVTRRAPDPDLVYGVALALAAFEHLGFTHDAQDEFDQFVSELLSSSWKNPAVRRAAESLITAGIVQKRGDYIRLTPLPLAVVLAVVWWRGYTPNKVIALMNSGHLTPQMVTSMVNQLRRLKGNPHAETIAAQLTGPSGPFGQRELVISATGSLILSSLAELNNEAVMGLLYRNFSFITPEEAFKINKGRRGLVWCLEKLAWWPDTFIRAATLLLRFAAGENETYSNNATGQFKQLFHLDLSGTEMPAIERLPVIRQGLATQDPRLMKVCIEALGAALTYGSFHRMGGVEAQGSGLPRRDWAPRRSDEVRAYWTEVIALLSPYLTNIQVTEERDAILLLAARQSFSTGVRGLISTGAIDLVAPTLRALAKDPQFVWPELLNQLRETAIWNAKRLEADDQATLDEIIKTIEPRRLEQQLHYFVSVPSYHERTENEAGDTINLAQDRAASLARQIASDPTELIQLLPTLLIDEQRLSFHFGAHLAQELASLSSVMDAAREALRAIPAERRNVGLLAGLVVQQALRERERARQFIYGLLADDDLCSSGVKLLISVTPDDEDCGRLIALLDDGKVKAQELSGLRIGRATARLSDGVFARLMFALVRSPAVRANRHDENGHGLALDLLAMHTHGRVMPTELYAVCKAMLLNVSLNQPIDQMFEHYYTLVLKKLLQAELSDMDFIKELAETLTKLLSEERSFGRPTSEALAILLRAHPQTVWPILGEGLCTLEFYWIDLRSRDLSRLLQTDRKSVV